MHWYETAYTFSIAVSQSQQHSLKEHNNDRKAARMYASTRCALAEISKGIEMTHRSPDDLRFALASAALAKVRHLSAHERTLNPQQAR